MIETKRQEGPGRGRRRIGVAFGAAFALHAGVVMALTLWPSQNAVSPPGEQEITIDLAPAMAEAEALETAEATPQPETPPDVPDAPLPEPVEEEPPPPEQNAEAVPPETPPEPPPVEEKPPEPIAPPEPQMVEALPLPPPQEEPKPEPPPKPVKRPEPKKAESRPPPKPRRTETVRQVAPSRQQAVSSRENTGGIAASADPNVVNRYGAQLAAALRRRLRYPASEEARGISGVATVRITIQRSGQISAASLVRSTGNANLDQAALAAAAPGTALPAMPDAIPQQQMTITVPLKFAVR